MTLAGLRQPARNAVVVGVLRGLLAAAGVGVLYWSGSKSGWLIALVMAGLAFWRLPAKAPFRLAILIGLTGLGIGAFFGKHRDYFEKGASSLAARLDYWRAAGRMIQERPFNGFGPGTYQRQYARLKPPEAEMAKLTHNDYLQQGADSGLPALIAYTGFIFGSVLWLYRRSRRSAVHFAVWLGGSAFAVQSLTEFGLYIPGLAWSFFLFLGWLWGTQPNEFDTLEAASYDCRQKT